MDDFWLAVWLAIEPWLWLILSLVVVYVLYKVSIFTVKRYAKKTEKFPKDATNGLILLIRIIVLFIVLFLVMPALSIPSIYLIDISTLLATALGFASTIVVSNLVGGLYMIISNPYHIGDFISVDGAFKGVVNEIGLNYTKLTDIDGVTSQIPNNKLFSSNITNYNQEPTQKKRKKKSIDDKVLTAVSNILIDYNKVRYVFDVDIALELDPIETIKILDQICDRWTSRLGYRPQYSYQNLSWRATIRWVLMGDTPEVVMKNQASFLEDVWLSVYKYSKEEAR